MPQMHGLFVGAYAILRGDGGGDDMETALLSALAADARMGGLELPFKPRATLAPGGIDWPAHWHAVVTTLPGVMSGIARDATFGLASTSAEGRAAAVAYLAEAADAVRRFNDSVGRQAVVAVEVHSAPRLAAVAADTRPQVDALAGSLDEVCRLDWDGAEVWLEHCDAQLGLHPVNKGFLRIEDELAAIAASGTPTGMCINWGRSAIEGRSAATAAAHLNAVQRAGRLRGYVFSGCSDRSEAYGIWRDTHCPHGPALGIDACEADSLLTADTIAATRRALAETAGAAIGLKLGMRPVDAPLADRLAMIDALATLLTRPSVEP